MGIKERQIRVTKWAKGNKEGGTYGRNAAEPRANEHPGDGLKLNVKETVLDRRAERGTDGESRVPQGKDTGQQHQSGSNSSAAAKAEGNFSISASHMKVTIFMSLNRQGLRLSA